MPLTSEMFEQAVAHHQAGCLESAEHLYRQIIRTCPQHADALHLLGVAAHQKHDHEQAVSVIRQAINVRHTYAPFHCNLGAAYAALNQFDEAIECYREAIRLDPGYADAHFNLGNAFWNQKQFEAAIACYERALQLRPKCAEAHHKIGDSLAELGRIDSAIEALQAAITINPNLAEPHFDLGNALKKREQHEQAAESYRRAIGCRPDYCDAHVNLGYVLDDMCRFDEAIASYDRAIAINPESAEAHFNRALVHLRRGDFSRGWREYDWRWKKNSVNHAASGATRKNDSLEGRSLLVVAEQGIGDQVMFASCLPDADEQAEICVVECDPRLVPLFRRSFSNIHVIPAGCERARDEAVQEPIEVEIGLASLPYWLRPSVDSFPEREKYLFADSSLLDKWRSRFGSLGAGLKVGVSWRGGQEGNVRRARSTQLDQWMPLFSLPGARFVNLQYGDTQLELETLQQYHGVRISDWTDSDPLYDLDDFAAKVAALDLVISVDNSTVHIAAALGRPVWTLLPFASDWRWMLDRSDAPWYPTMRLYRQQHLGVWHEVFQRAASDLEMKLRHAKLETQGIALSQLNAEQHLA